MGTTAKTAGLQEYIYNLCIVCMRLEINLWVNDMNILFKHFFKTFFLKILFFSNLYTQCRAQTHNLEINIPILDKVSQPGAPDVNILEYIALSELLEHTSLSYC